MKQALLAVPIIVSASWIPGPVPLTLAAGLVCYAGIALCVRVLTLSSFHVPRLTEVDSVLEAN
jgi:hypothetical protein